MRRLDRELRLLEQQANAWGALVRRLRLNGNEMVEDLQELQLPLSGGETIGAAFVLERFAVEVGRVRERIDGYAECFLGHESRLVAARENVDALLTRVLPANWVERREQDQRWIGSSQIAGLFDPLFESATRDLPERDDVDFERALMDRVFLVRRIGALTQALSISAVRVVLGEVGRFFSTPGGVVGGVDLSPEISGGIRHFLASEHLAPWSSAESNAAYARRRYLYENLFALAGLRGDNGMTDTFSKIDGRLARLGSTELGEEVRRIIDRVGEAVAQYGYEEWRSIVQDGISGGVHSPLGNANPINIIPATDLKGSCHDVLLAVSSGLSKKSAAGLGSILSQVRVHLLKCKNTKVVIIVADAWDPAVYGDSKPDFEQHMANGVGFVRLDVMDARRITPILFD